VLDTTFGRHRQRSPQVHTSSYLLTLAATESLKLNDDKAADNMISYHDEGIGCIKFLCLPKAKLNTPTETKRPLLKGSLVSFLVFQFNPFLDVEKERPPKSPKK